MAKRTDESNSAAKSLSSANADAIDPTCDKCGAPVTTGIIAAFCPYFRECEFYTPELDDFMNLMDWSPPFPNAEKKP